MLSVFVLGLYLGYSNGPAIERVKNLTNKEAPLSLREDLDFNPFWQAWEFIEKKYVSNNGLDRQKMVWGAVSGLVGSLDDPYSVFFPPEESEVFKSNVRGDFEGVGMEIGMRKKLLTVIAPLKAAPAEKAGIKTGDTIIEINGETTMDITLDEAVQKIRGEKGTKVILTILREGREDPFKIEIIRDKIEIPVLDTEVKENGVFVIELYNFSARSNSEFRNALGEMLESGSDKLIVDLRGNPGGYLESAVDMASWFLPSGEVVVRERFSNNEEKLYRSKGYDLFEDLEMVVLVNQGSASASEIFAGALRDHDVAVLVGQQTYGKGSVQELLSVDGNSSLKLTIARWLTPNGDSISEKGLTPDVEVEYIEEDFEAGRDPQMERAMEILSQ